MLRLVKYTYNSSSLAVASEVLKNVNWLRVQAMKTYSDRYSDDTDVAVERLTCYLFCWDCHVLFLPATVIQRFSLFSHPLLILKTECWGLKSRLRR